MHEHGGVGPRGDDVHRVLEAQARARREPVGAGAGSEGARNRAALDAPPETSQATDESIRVVSLLRERDVQDGDEAVLEDRGEWGFPAEPRYPGGRERDVQGHPRAEESGDGCQGGDCEEHCVPDFHLWCVHVGG